MLFPWFQEWKSLVISESWSLPMCLSPELYFVSPTPGWWRGGHGKNKANISKAWLHYLKISKQETPTPRSVPLSPRNSMFFSFAHQK